MARTRTVYVRESTGGRIFEQSRVRLVCVGLFFTLCFVSLSARLVEMMIASPGIAPHRLLPSVAQGDEATEGMEVMPTEARLTRGDIVDRNGVLLATSLMTASAFANPREMRSLDTAAEKLAKTLRMDKNILFKRLKDGKTFVWIKRHLTPVEQQAVNALGIPGVYFLPEERRVYPHGAALSHVLGYVGVDNKGLSGIEKTFDQALSDTGSHKPVRLSVDVRVQHIVRAEMQKAMQEFRAIGATGIVMDAKSGEIIAMSSLPDFDPHRPSKASDEQKFNRAVLGTYEMGSTFKSFTLAMALNSGKVKLKDSFDATAPLKISTFTISDTHPKKRWLTLPEIYAYSSNIGTAKVALTMGTQAQKRFLSELGMLKPISLELPERPQPQFPSEWKEINTVTISYGHGISVTPLHLVRGISAMVNGGTLPQPTLIKQEDEPLLEERIISRETSEKMRALMRIVVRHGTAGKADVPGYHVGGKTGTAEKINAGGKYSKDAKISSFIGAFPMDDPKYVVLVMIDEPKGNKSTYGYATGGWVAAPAVGHIISRMAPMLGMAPAFEEREGDTEAEQYWVDSQPKNVQTVAAKKAVMPPPTTAALDPRYLHAAAY